MIISPIALFVYNRPEHTLLILEALEKNQLAKKSILYVFADGIKSGADVASIHKVNQVKNIIKSKSWCKQTIIIKREHNFGLAKSIISGVTEVIRKHKKVIVLEDDILVSTGFLSYMNDALNLYEHEEKVGCIHAWNYDFPHSKVRESTFFLKGADCWGWATWERAWSLFEPNGQQLLTEIADKKLAYSFDRNGTHSFFQMLKDQIAGNNDSWAIRWHASLFLKNKFCLQPAKAIVKNIGLDGSGIHCGANGMQQNPVMSINVNKIPIEEPAWFFKEMNKYNRNINKTTVLKKIKTIIYLLLRKFNSPINSLSA